MYRVSTFIGIKKDQQNGYLSTLTDFQKIEKEHHKCKLSENDVDFLKYYVSDLQVDKDVYKIFLIMPIQSEMELHCELIRKLMKDTDPDNNIIGPFSPKEMERLYPTWASENLYQQEIYDVVKNAKGEIISSKHRKIAGRPMIMPMVIAGDTPEIIAKLDYQPTKLKSIENVKMTKVEIEEILKDVQPVVTIKDGKGV